MIVTSTLRSILERVSFLVGTLDVINVSTQKDGVLGHTGIVELGFDGKVTRTILGCIASDPKDAECTAMFKAIDSILQCTTFAIKDFSFYQLRDIEACTASMRRVVRVLSNAANRIVEITYGALCDANAISPSVDDKLIEIYSDYASKCRAQLEANRDTCYP